ncbi:MAG: hypothetical protein ACK5OC_00945 [Pirellula sp.]
MADALWGRRWPTDAMSVSGDALGELAEISRQCATSCDTRTHAGVAKFGSEVQRRSMSYIREFEASRSGSKRRSKHRPSEGRF